MTPTTDHPTFEGRRLPNPREEVVDQGLQFDLVTMTNRRRALQLLGVGLAGGVLAACGTDATTAASGSSSVSGSGTSATGDLIEIPEETAGPYPGDGSNGPDVLELDGVVRQDIRASFAGASGTADGVPMTVTLTLLDIAGGGSPMVGAAVYAWHCTREGGYSMYSDGVTNENFLRGVQVTDGAGVVRFASIFPGCYSGRWPHIHFEVYPDQASITDASAKIATSQVALPKATCDAVYATSGYESSVNNFSGMSLTSDNVFGNDGGVHQLGTAGGDVTAGFTVALTVPVDTTTAASTGGGPA